MLRRPLIGPDHDLWSEDIDPAALFGHPGRDHPLKITDGEQITTVIPLIARDQCSRRHLEPTAVQREPVTNHVNEQLFHSNRQTHLLPFMLRR
jgi:hypothetical protein